MQPFAQAARLTPARRNPTLGAVHGVIRHPSYLGPLVNSLGLVLAFRPGAGLLLTTLIVPPLLARIRAEERLPRAQFGADYDAYRART